MAQSERPLSQNLLAESVLQQARAFTGLPHNLGRLYVRSMQIMVAQ